MPPISSRELKELGIDHQRDAQLPRHDPLGRRHTRASSYSSIVTTDARVNKQRTHRGKRRPRTTGAERLDAEAPEPHADAEGAALAESTTPTDPVPPELERVNQDSPEPPPGTHLPPPTLADELAAVARRHGTDEGSLLQEPPGAFPPDQLQNFQPQPPPLLHPASSPAPAPDISPALRPTSAPASTEVRPFRPYPTVPVPSIPRPTTYHPFRPPTLHWSPRIVTFNMASNPGSAGPAEPERYSYNQYRRDAMVLLELDERQRQGEELPGFERPIVFTDAELATARTVQRLMRRPHREQARQRAREYLRTRHLTPLLLIEWRRRFNNGPDENDEDDELDNAPPPPDPPRPVPPMPTRQPSAPPPVGPTPVPRHRTEETEEIRRHFSPPGRSPPRRPQPDHTRYIPPARQMSMPGSHRREHRHRRHSSDPSGSDSGSDRSRRGRKRRERSRRYQTSAYPNVDMFNQRRLKPEEMGLFDGQSMSVHLYVRQIQHRVRLYGYQRVLEVLPLCMKGDAMDWYTSLSDNQLNRMTTSVDEWIIALRHRFQKDSMLAEDEANRCKHSFERESLDVRQYITRKQTLLYDAGFEGQDELLLIQKIWRDLDPTLQNAVTIDPYMTMEDFVSLCYQKEYSARRMFEQQQRQATGHLRVAAQEFARARCGQEQAPAPRPALRPMSTNPRALPEPPRPAMKTITDNAAERPLAYPCRHCGKNHKDYECPDRPPRRSYGQKRVAFMMDFMDRYIHCDFSDEDANDSAPDSDAALRSDDRCDIPQKAENE